MTVLIIAFITLGALLCVLVTTDHPAPVAKASRRRHVTDGPGQPGREPPPS